MNYILHQKQKLNYLITKSLHQNPKIKDQTSEEIKPLENFANSTVVLYNMLLSNQASKIDLFFFLQEDVTVILINTLYLNFFSPATNTIRNTSNINIFCNQL